MATDMATKMATLMQQKPCKMLPKVVLVLAKRSETQRNAAKLHENHLPAYAGSCQQKCLECRYHHCFACLSPFKDFVKRLLGGRGRGEKKVGKVGL